MIIRIIPLGGSIPPNIREGGSKPTTSSGGNPKPKYKTLSTKHLEGLLSRATELNSQLMEVVKIDPGDENIARLDKMEHIIQQLKVQIKTRK